MTSYAKKNKTLDRHTFPKRTATPRCTIGPHDAPQPLPLLHTLSQCHTVTQSQCHSVTLTHTHSHTHTLTLALTHTLTLTLTLTETHTDTLTFTLTQSHNHTHTLTLTLTVTRSHTHTLTQHQRVAVSQSCACGRLGSFFAAPSFPLGPPYASSLSLSSQRMRPRTVCAGRSPRACGYGVRGVFVVGLLTTYGFVRLLTSGR